MPDQAVATVPVSAALDDPLGERRHVADNSGHPIEILCLSRDLTSVPLFDAALRGQVERLAAFRHAYYARVRGVESMQGTLALVSERADGVRLSSVLAAAEAERITLDINTALSIIRQLVPAVALLHEQGPDIWHGAIAPERIVITPHARLVIVEHVLGPALKQLRYAPERYWRELRVPLPPADGAPTFDQRSDVMQLGMVALSLISGRAVRTDEYPSRVEHLATSAWAISPTGGLDPLPHGLRSWLMRALQLDPKTAFRSALEARTELENMVGAGDYIVAPLALETFMLGYQAACQPPLAKASVAQTASEGPAHHLRQGYGGPPKRDEAQPRAKAEAGPHNNGPKDIRGVRREADLQCEADDVEDDDERDVPMRSTHAPRWRRASAIAVILVAVAVGTALGGRRYLAHAPAGLPTGTIVVNTNPSGAELSIDGDARGATPITLTVNAGAHTIELRGPGEPRTIPVTVTAGAQVTQYIELAKAIVASGRLQIRTEPSGARVSVDEIMRGPSPITVADLAPGVHTVAVETEGGPLKQSLTIEAGATASLVVPLSTAPPAAASGWISVHAPLEMRLYENGRLLGSTESDRIMVPAGKHEVEIVSQPLAYRAVRTLQVTAGKTATLEIDLPTQKIAINALPWAEVWIDGKRAGETPIGDFQVSIGPHEILFRHPTFGEQRQGVTVTATAPARVTADLRK